MNITLGKKYRKRRGYLSVLLAKNPVLVLGLDLPFVIVCATTLKMAVALSIEMFIIHMVTMVAALITIRTLPMWARMLVNIGVAFIMMTVARQLVTMLFPDLSNHAGMYIYLMAVNGITVYQSAHLSRKAKAGPVLTIAFMNALAFSLTMLIVSLFREYLAGGTLWGVPVSIPFRLTGLALPFGGFIFMGFLLAFAKLLNKKLLAFTIGEAIRRDAQYTEIKAPTASGLTILSIETLPDPSTADSTDDANPSANGADNE